MMPKPWKIQHCCNKSPKAKHQQQARWKNNLFLKSFEFCCKCDTDIILMVQLTKWSDLSLQLWQLMESLTGGASMVPPQDLFGYTFLMRHMQAMSYPNPKQIEQQDLAARYMTKPSLEVLHDQTIDHAWMKGKVVVQRQSRDMGSIVLSSVPLCLKFWASPLLKHRYSDCDEV